MAKFSIPRKKTANELALEKAGAARAVLDEHNKSTATYSLVQAFEKAFETRLSNHIPNHVPERDRFLGLNSSAADVFLRLIRQAEKADFLKKPQGAVGDFGNEATNNYFTALRRIAERWHFFVNKPEGWKPKAHNPYRQFISLVSHLFAKYPVPNFLASLWFEADSFKVDWYIDLAQGESVRSLPRFPPVTRQIAHAFMRAPGDFTLDRAFRQAQIKSLKNFDRRLTREVEKIRISFNADHERRLSALLLFFDNNPMFDRTHFRAVYDFMANTPDFNLSGRTPASVLRLVDDWHRNLRRDEMFRAEGGKDDEVWERTSIPGYDKVYGEGTKHFDHILIYEISTYGELKREGKELEHCVASYAGSCKAGRIAIFTMKHSNDNFCFKRLVTIEVETRNQTVTQIRGKLNRRATTKEMKWIKDWTQIANLKTTVR